ncbi:carbohydrate esterase family 5 protein [Annulohypoxylon truncatum]|uniref:carbohydrate esterase family 5 protein n=1 Tax=Annulohypoxylon truncatum TaxID=327061 RepID=UPI002007E616|nr:carbohydrate esterase family 5 protein [Annulohypoxylon truncatum]KAI1212115.1 carbohydrate esterase family 5 protein [Annulohypoxylon truncatum]
MAPGLTGLAPMYAMRLSLTLLSAALAASAAAIPLTLDYSESTIAKLKARQTASAAGSIQRRQSTGDTANEFLDGGCRDVIFIFARGSTQDGNIGDDPGPQTIDQLKAALGTDTVAAQGVDYPALLIDNLRAGGCDPADADNMRALITQAATQCPTAKLVVSGYSQGAALVHRSVEAAEAGVKERIYAAVTYGDTQKAQDDDHIPDFDPGKTLILCHDGDEVCEGTLIVTDAHSGYSDLAPEAVSFIVSKV